MKFAVIVFSITLLAATLAKAASDARSATMPAADTTAADQAAVRSMFLNRLHQLASDGDLLDAGSVAHILEMKFNEPRIGKGKPRDCGDGTSSWIDKIEMEPAQTTWFRELHTGAGHIKVPAFAINPATTSGDPQLKYEIYHSVQCADWSRMRDKQQAHMSFSGLPAFSCITGTQITEAIPEIRSYSASDGVFIMELNGRVNDDAATNLTFFFRAGAACALGAELNQDPEKGHRYLRALDKYEACRIPVDREFCAKHPNIGWGDRELREEMVMQAYRRCGLINDFYLKEPRSGESPPSRPEPRRRRSPCGDLL